MGLATNLTRIWLTRSFRPFTFRNEYDSLLPYAECRDLGLYIHIPFCKTVCGFCPYCKMPYSEELCDRYIGALLREIELVGRQHDGRKRVTSLYFGGGTPALAAGRFGDLIETLGKHFLITGGIGAELHPDNVTPPVLRLLKESGVTKISIGVQSFQEKFQRVLGRRAVNAAALAGALAEVPFETVSMDFIFALPGQTFGDLKADIDTAFENGANHIAVYPFIDFAFTRSGITAMPKKEKRELLDAVTAYCTEKGYARHSIWTFSKDPRADYSSMTRNNFLGFGCSAATLLKDQFKINTFSVEAYCRRLAEGKLPTSLTLRFSRRQRMIYYLFWTAYGMRIDPAAFGDFFGVPLERMYGLELKIAERLGFLFKKDGIWQMTPKGAFYFHHYENFYTLAYIDKMWGIMRREAFPERIEL